MSSPRIAATAVLIREGSAGPEILMLKRSSHGFFGNMWVFPGGAIEPADRDHAEDEFAAARLAAIRETSEETGIRLKAQDLLPFAHWTPPEGIPTRFVTWFFVIQVDPTLDVLIDNHEIIDHRWIHARRALGEHHQGRMAMAPPTVVTLEEFARHREYADIRAFYRERGVFSYLPKFVKRDKGSAVSLYQGDAGYASANPDVPGARHRLVIETGICTFEMSGRNEDEPS